MTTGERPARGTPEYDLWITAIEIAAYAPLRQNDRAFAAQIPWQEIHALRAALDKLGLDWQEVKRQEGQRRRDAVGGQHSGRRA